MGHRGWAPWLLDLRTATWVPATKGRVAGHLAPGSPSCWRGSRHTAGPMLCIMIDHRTHSSGTPPAAASDPGPQRAGGPHPSTGPAGRTQLLAPARSHAPATGVCPTLRLGSWVLGALGGTSPRRPTTHPSMSARWGACSCLHPWPGCTSPPLESLALHAPLRSLHRIDGSFPLNLVFAWDPTFSSSHRATPALRTLSTEHPRDAQTSVERRHCRTIPGSHFGFGA